MRALTYFIGTTIDGFIAGPRGETAFFPLPDDIAAFLAAEYPETLPTAYRSSFGVDGSAANRHFDTVVMGRSTYEPALAVGITNPYEHLDSYVISSTMTQGSDPAVTVSGEPVQLVRRLKEQPGSGIWLAGGGTLAGTLLPEIDELVIKQYPVVAGAGIPMFGLPALAPTGFLRTDARLFDSGALVSWYARAEPGGG